VYKTIPGIILYPGEQKEQALVTDLPIKDLGENCIKFSFDFKREFEKYYVSSSYRGHISYDVDVQPGRVSVSRKASDAEKYKVSIDEIEKETGLDFFSNIPDNIEEKIESMVNMTLY
jgi:hypothetical protein